MEQTAHQSPPPVNQCDGRKLAQSYQSPIKQQTHNPAPPLVNHCDTPELKQSDTKAPQFPKDADIEQTPNRSMHDRDDQELKQTDSRVILPQKDMDTQILTNTSVNSTDRCDSQEFKPNPVAPQTSKDLNKERTHNPSMEQSDAKEFKQPYPVTRPAPRDMDTKTSTMNSSAETPVRPVLQWSSSLPLQPVSEEEMLDLMEGRDPGEIISAMPPCQCDSCVLDDDQAQDQPPTNTKPPLKRQSSWKKIRSIVRWSPFIQVFKKHRYPWIQLAGHQGNFQAGEAGCVLKKLDSREHQSVQTLMSDRLQPFVPQYKGTVQRDGQQYVELQDLLCEFSSPSVMDVKMGVRTFLETEILAARHKPTLRKDMYEKMTEVDPDAPTEEEHSAKAVTKARYMQWRDDISSSHSLGFRIEGIKNSDGTSCKDFKKTKSRQSVSQAFSTFFGINKTLLSAYLQRLRDIASAQESSDFFRAHELVGSSLLFVHDSTGKVGVWMIDFGKTQPLPSTVSITHRAAWLEGNHEDGYLFGVDNIVSILQDMQESCVE